MAERRSERITSFSASDWANQFFASGWKGQPWVVVERLPGDAQRLERDIFEDTDGWLFEAYSHRILHAPTYDVYAAHEAQLRIVEAIRRFPKRRATEFQTFERPSYEALGWPPTVLDQVTPRADVPLKAERFSWPVLLVTTDPETGEYFLLGSVSSMDILLPALVHRRDVPVDDAMALLVLLTCHGGPGEGYAKSPFTRPLHPKRFKQVLHALRGRSRPPVVRSTEQRTNSPWGLARRAYAPSGGESSSGYIWSHRVRQDLNTEVSCQRSNSQRRAD